MPSAAAAQSTRSLVLPRLRELLRLIGRLPGEKERSEALAQVRCTIRPRLAETDAQCALDHRRELESKIAYLRVVTPKSAGGARGGDLTTTYVMRNGKLVESCGESRGSRCACMCISVRMGAMPSSGMHACSCLCMCDNLWRQLHLPHARYQLPCHAISYVISLMGG